jgi:uncharacterized protein YndB with AHSA1/START domain
VADDSMLAVFVDRTTMRHDRTYPHTIELVWEAVTTSEHLDVWLLPVSRVERRLGGVCTFSWGGPEEQSIVGEVTEFEPPRVIQYTFGDERSFLRFELAPDGDGTRLSFTQSFAPEEGTDTQEDAAYPAADRPAGPDTPWRPGFVAGFHQMLDELDLYLRGEWTEADRAADLAAHLANRPDSEHLRMIDIYRDHIREHCPRA